MMPTQPREYIEELLERKRSGSGLESREYGLRDSSRSLRGALHPQKMGPTSLTSGRSSVGIVRSRTQATKFSFSFSFSFSLSLSFSISFMKEG
jgi:hypothetical protein